MPEIPRSISHKKLTSFMVKAKKESFEYTDIKSNDESKHIDGLENLLDKWHAVSQETIKILSATTPNTLKQRSPKSIMALGAMEAHINMAIQALRASKE